MELRTSIVHVLLLLSFIIITKTEDPGPGMPIELCPLDHLDVQCDPGKVIMMASAEYGRMTASHCITSSQLGCSSDALGLADRWCSGRDMCYIDEGFQTHLNDKLRACSRDLDKYLEFTYTCVDVVSPMSIRCGTNGMPARVLHQSEGFISSHVTRNTGCGLAGAPWVIEAPSGSTINLEVIDFSWAFNSGSCDKTYFEIFDVESETKTSICAKNERRHGPYRFSTSAVKLQMLPQEEGTYFLVHFYLSSDTMERTGALSSGSPRSGQGHLVVMTGSLMILMRMLWTQLSNYS